MDFWSIVNSIGNGIGNFFTGEGSPWQFISDPSAWWDHFKNGETNTTEKEIAQENLNYQQERNEIEDTRYEEETGYNRSFSEEEQAYQRAFAEEERDYNRAFAEEERAYNRALQQELFNREDTALERQASSLSKMGINPLSQNMNGLGAGQAISSSLPSSSSYTGAVAPSISSRGGTALHNDFHMQDQGMLPALSALSGLASVMNGISTGQYQRDSLALQNDRMYLENMEKANDLGIIYRHKKSLGDRLNFIGDQTIRDENGIRLQDNSIFDNKYNKSYYKSQNEANSEFYKIDNQITDSMDPKIRFMNELSNLDFENIATRLMTNMVSTGKKLGDDFKKDFGSESSPFLKFFKLFF